MESQQEFLEGLQDLVQIGKTSGDVLSQEEIRDYFSDMTLDDSQMPLIAAYMAENQIHITGILPAELPEEQETVQSEEEPSAALQMYMEEIRSVSPKEEIRYLKRWEQGDPEAARQLVEMNLEEVANIANQYRNQGVQTNDLIQEGNLALFCAISEYDSSTCEDFHSYIMKEVRLAMEEAIKENTISTRGARKMAQLINQMNDIATAMAKEFGREAKPEELAEKMKISVEEVKDLMKVSLDAVNAFEQK